MEPVKGRIRHLDGLRGVAILFVILFHSFSRWPLLYPYKDSIEKLRIFNFGWVGVQLFFIISGFVISLSLEKSKSMAEFMFRRWLRLFPAMLSCSVLLFLTAPLFPERPAGQPSLIDLLPGISFISNQWWYELFHIKAGLVEGSFWSLFVEVKFYLIFGALYFLCGSAAAIGVIFVSFVISKIWMLVPFAPALLTSDLMWVENLLLELSADHYGWFAAGALFYRYKTGEAKSLTPALFVSGISALFVRDFWLAAAAAAFFVSLLFGLSLVSASVQKLLCQRWLLFFGFISYPLYLMHENMMVSMIVKLGALLPAMPAALVPAIPLLIVSGISWVIACWVEHPMRNLLTSWLRGFPASCLRRKPRYQSNPYMSAMHAPMLKQPLGKMEQARNTQSTPPLRSASAGTDHLQRHVCQVNAGMSFASQWEALYKTAGNRSIFLSREWIETWLEIYGAYFDKKWVWWSQGEQVVGACLLLAKKVRVKSFTFDTLFLNATGITPERSPLAEFNDVLCVPGFEDAVAADFAALLQELPWDRFVTGGHLDRGVISRAIAKVGAFELEIDSKPAPYTDFRQLAESPFADQLTSSTRNQIRRCSRIYEERFGPMSIDHAVSEESAMQYFDLMAQTHNDRWKKKGIDGSFSNAPAVEFHHRIISKLWRRAQVELLCVKAGEKNVGILYNFIESGKVYFFQSGFFYEDDNRIKPGLLTHSLAIESYRMRGFREYDFLAGDSQYKRSLAKKHRMLHWTTVYRDNAQVRLFISCRQAWNILRKVTSYIRLRQAGAQSA